MNERITELARQCASQDHLAIYNSNYAKFAELIVAECIDVISPYAVRMENFDGGHPISDLKKHFGIEQSLLDNKSDQ